MRLRVERMLLGWIDIWRDPAWTGGTRTLIAIGAFIAAILSAAASLGLIDSPEWLRPWLLLLLAVIGSFSILTFIAIGIEKAKSKPEPVTAPFTEAYEMLTVKELEQEIIGVEVPYIRREIKKLPGSPPASRSERILLIGQRGLGKTREAYELIKGKRLDVTILRPKGLVAVPIRPSSSLDKVILFIDNLPRFYQGGYEQRQGIQRSLEEAVSMFEQACYSLTVVCTANPDELAKLPPGWDTSSFWASFDQYHLPRLDEKQTAEFVDELAHRYDKVLTPEIREQIIKSNKDGSLGNLVLFFTQLGDKRHVEDSDLDWLRKSMAETWEAIYKNLVADKKTFGRVFESMGVLYQGRVTLYRKLVTDLALRLNVPSARFTQEQLESAIDELIASDWIREERGILRCFDVQLETRGDFASALFPLIQLTFNEDPEVQNMVYPSLPGLYAAIKSIWHIDLSREERERILKAWIKNNYFGGFRTLEWDVAERSKKWALPFRQYLWRNAVTQGLVSIIASLLGLALVWFGLDWLDRRGFLPSFIGVFRICIVLLVSLVILAGFKFLIRDLWMLLTRRHFSESDFQSIEEQFLTRYDALPQGIAPSAYELPPSIEEKRAIRQWLLQDRFPVRGSRIWFLLSWIAKSWSGRQKYSKRATIVPSSKTDLDRFPIEEHNAVIEIMLFYTRYELVDYTVSLLAKLKGHLLRPRRTLSRIASIFRGWRIGPRSVYVLVLAVTCVVFLLLWPRLSTWWLQIILYGAKDFLITLITLSLPLTSFCLLLYLLCLLPLALLLFLLLLFIKPAAVIKPAVVISAIERKQPQWLKTLSDFLDRPIKVLVPDHLKQQLRPLTKHGSRLLTTLQNNRLLQVRNKRLGFFAAIVWIYLPGILAKSVYDGIFQSLVWEYIIEPLVTLLALFLLFLPGLTAWLIASIVRVFRRKPPAQFDWNVIRRYRAEYLKYNL